MNATTAESKPARLRGPQGPRLKPAAPEAKAIAAAILDVLAGGRTPQQAAESLGISQPRYYALEARALDGLVKSCEPRPKGRVREPRKEVEGLRREVERLKRELDRRQALIRAAHRTVGLAPPPPKIDQRRRKRRPVVRALKAAAVLRSAPPAPAPPAPEHPMIKEDPHGPKDVGEAAR
jgi:hypothetical protein